MKQFNLESPFFEFMGRVGDMMLLNILFLICCIPIVTVGAAYSSMYAVLLEQRENQDISVVRSFFENFKKDWKQKIAIGTFFSLAGGILGVDILFLGNIGGKGVWSIFSILIGGLVLLWLMVTSYIYILMGTEMGSLKNLIKDSFYLAVYHLPRTVGMILLNSIPMICQILGNYFIGLIVPIYCVIGFSVTAYINVVFLYPKNRKERFIQ